MLKSLFLLLLLVPGAPAQSPSTFTIVGNVRTPDGQGISGVRVSLVDENFQIVEQMFVDVSGRFRFRRVRMGRYTIRVETSGTLFEEQATQLELSSLRRLGGDETVPVEINLRYKKSSEGPSRRSSVFAQDIPKTARIEFERGVSKLKDNQSQAAVASFKKAVEIFPDYFEALESLGVEYTKEGQFESAVEILARSLKINSRAPKSLYAMGVANLNLHRLPEAIDWLSKAAQLEPGSPNTQMMLGLAYGNSGALDKSEAAFKKSLQFGGTAAAEAHFYLAGLYNKQGKHRQAREELEHFLKDSKNIKDPAQIRAMIEKLKEKEKAKSEPPQSAATYASPSANHQTLTQPPSPAENNTERLDPATVTGRVAETERSPAAPVAEDNSAETNALMIAPIQPLPPEFVDVLKQGEANGGAMHRHLYDYTYLLKKTRRVLDDRGNPVNTEEEIFEAYPIRGEHVLIRLSTNGLPSRTLADDRKRAVKQLEEAERRKALSAMGDHAEGRTEDMGYVSAGVSGAYNGRPGYVSINISAMFRACEFFSPRVEKINGRETLVLNFRRRAGISLPTNQSYISKLIGTVWIDQTDKIVARLEAWPAAQAAFDLLQSTAPRDHAALIYQQQRQANGMWFPSMIRMNAGGREELFNGLNWDVVFEFSNYQHFDTSADNLIINPPNKNQK